MMLQSRYCMVNSISHSIRLHMYTMHVIMFYFLNRSLIGIPKE